MTSWSPLYSGGSWVLDSPGNAGEELRQIMPPLSQAISQVRITFSAQHAGVTTFSHVSVGVQAAGSTCKTAPVELLFGGQSGFSLAANAAPIVSDPLPFNANAGDVLIIIADETSPAVAKNSGIAETFFSSAATWNQAQQGGTIGSTAATFGISLVEVMPVAQPSSGPTLIAANVALPLPRLPSFDLLAGTVPSLPGNDTLTPSDIWSFIVARHVAAQSSLAAAGGHVAMIGDSILQNSDVSQCSPFAFNYGIADDTAGGILNRIGSYSALHNARAVVLESSGINDFTGSIPLSTVQVNLANLFAWLTGPLVFVAVTPTSSAAINSLTSQLNAWSEVTLAGRARTVVVDLTAQLSLNGLLNPSLTIDGTHLNGAGWTIYAGAVNAALGQV